VTRCGHGHASGQAVASRATLAGGRTLASGSAGVSRPLRETAVGAAGVTTVDRRPTMGRLGDRLVAEGLINADQLQRALSAQKGTRDKLGTVLIRMNYLTEERLLAFLTRQYNVPSITLSHLDIDPEVLRLVPAPPARRVQVLPIKRNGNVLTLAMADPTNVLALDDIAFFTNLQIQPVVASEVAIRQATERLYGNHGESMADMMSELEEAESD